LYKIGLKKRTGNGLYSFAVKLAVMLNPGDGLPVFFVALMAGIEIPAVG
jgi:hypothetical protein